MKSKAQTFMPDYIGSIVVFFVLITVFLSSWNSVVSDEVAFEEEDEMRFQGVHTTTFLVATPGYPEDWNSSNVQIPGFAEPDHFLQQEKLEEFRDINYDRQKTLLQAENFQIKIRNSSGLIEMNGSDLAFGQEPVDAETVVPFTRTVQVNVSGKTRTAEMRYIVWN